MPELENRYTKAGYKKQQATAATAISEAYTAERTTEIYQIVYKNATGSDTSENVTITYNDANSAVYDGVLFTQDSLDLTGFTQTFDPPLKILRNDGWTVAFANSDFYSVGITITYKEL